MTDHLLFPFHELKNEKEVYNFKKNLKEKWIFSLFKSLEYNKEKKIDNLERFLTRTETAAFIVILIDIFSALREGIINISGGEKSAKKEKMISLHMENRGNEN